MDELSENLKLVEKLGGPDTYEHYPTGWAAAFSTPPGPRALRREYLRKRNFSRPRRWKK